MTGRIGPESVPQAAEICSARWLGWARTWASNASSARRPRRRLRSGRVRQTSRPLTAQVSRPPTEVSGAQLTPPSSLGASTAEGIRARREPAHSHAPAKISTTQGGVCILRDTPPCVAAVPRVRTRRAARSDVDTLQREVSQFGHLIHSASRYFPAYHPNGGRSHCRIASCGATNTSGR